MNPQAFMPPDFNERFKQKTSARRPWRPRAVPGRGGGDHGGHSHLHIHDHCF